MSLSSLPLEIVSLIVSFLSPDSLIPYVTVNRQWQAVIERQTFSTLNLSLARLPEFGRIVAESSSRRFHIRQLNLCVVLPEYDVAARRQFETDQDCDANNQVFTETIASLLRILHSWSDSNHQVSLLVYARCPSDWRNEPDKKERMRRRLWGRKIARHDLLDWRYHLSYLQFSELNNELPQVTAIVRLEIEGGKCRRMIAPSAVSKLASRLPRLQNVSGWLFDDERKEHRLRDTLRNEFALSIAQWPRSVQHLTLNYPGAPPKDGNFPPLQRSSAGKDPFCLALHQLSQQLVTIDIRHVMIAPELFWPPDTPSELPQWPRLTSLALLYQAATPSGEWLFEKDPRCKPYTLNWEDPSDHHPEPNIPGPQDYYPDHFRTKPADTLNEMYHAAGRAAQRMPILQEMVLESIPQPAPYGMRDVLGGTSIPRHWFRYNRAEGAVVWAGSGEFHPSSDVVDCWKNVAISHGHARVHVQNVEFENCPQPVDFDSVVRDERYKKFFGYKALHDGYL